MRDQSLENILYPWIGALRVDTVYILSDVVYREIFEDWDLDLWFGFGHCGPYAKVVFLLKRGHGEASTTVHCEEDVRSYAEIMRRSSEVEAMNDKVSGQGKQYGGLFPRSLVVQTRRGRTSTPC
jgi:hypothetical protein